MNHPRCPTVQVVHTKSSLSLTEESVFFQSVTVTYILVYFILSLGVGWPAQFSCVSSSSSISHPLSSISLSWTLVPPSLSLIVSLVLVSTILLYVMYPPEPSLVHPRLPFTDFVTGCHPQSSFLYVSPLSLIMSPGQECRRHSCESVNGHTLTHTHRLIINWLSLSCINNDTTKIYCDSLYTRHCWAASPLTIIILW